MIMFPVRPYRFLGALVLLLLTVSLTLFAQVSECPPAVALLSSTAPVYADAMELKQSLESHGFVVRCVFPTKMGSIFQVTEGRCFAQHN